MPLPRSIRFQPSNLSPSAQNNDVQVFTIGLQNKSYVRSNFLNLPTDKMAVAERVAQCLQLFTDMSQTVRDPSRAVPAGSFDANLDAEFDRFKIWSGNVGAHRTDNSSLDYRLREAMALRDRVTELLDELLESITEGNTL